MTVPLGSSAELPLRASEEERVTLQVEYARGMIDINKKAQELSVACRR